MTTSHRAANIVGTAYHAAPREKRSIECCLALSVDNAPRLIGDVTKTSNLKGRRGRSTKYLKGACRDIDSMNDQCLYSTPFCIYVGMLGHAVLVNEIQSWSNIKSGSVIVYLLLIALSLLFPLKPVGIYLNMALRTVSKPRC